MSQNMEQRNNIFVVNVGSLETITVVKQDSTGTAEDLTNSTTYNTVKLHVWQPNGTLIINAAGSYGTRSAGQVQYTFASADTAATNAGNWQGMFFLYDNLGNISGQTDLFNLTIRQTY